MSDFNNEKYPIGSLKPKAETGVISFLAKYPNFGAGDDVTIAIFDSGVDPNAAGLKVCCAISEISIGIYRFLSCRFPQCNLL